MSGQRAEPAGSDDEPLGAGGLLPADRAELERLYRSEAVPLARYIGRRIGSRDEALDLAQDAFSRLAGAATASAAGIARPRAYLQRIARNLIRDRVKTNHRRCAPLHVAAEEEALPGPDQQRLLEGRDLLRRLEAALSKLKPRTREIFLAHRLDGLSYAEIAERTGLSVKGVEKQMSKAIAHIDRTLDRR